MALRFVAGAWSSLHGAAVAAWPEEGAGLLFGPRDEPFVVDQVVVLENRAADPRRGYRLDERAVAAAIRRSEAMGREHRGTFHTHPRGGAELSLTDRRELAPAGEPLWPGVVQVVVAVGEAGVRELMGHVFDRTTRAWHRVALERGSGSVPG